MPGYRLKSTPELLTFPLTIKQNRRRVSAPNLFVTLLFCAIFLALPQAASADSDPSTLAKDSLTDSVRTLINKNAFDQALSLIRGSTTQGQSDAECAFRYCLLSEVWQAIADDRKGSVSDSAGDTNWSMAVAYLDSAIACMRDYSDAWLRKGNLFWGKVQFEEALACFDTAITYDPENGYVWFFKASLSMLNMSLTGGDLADVVTWFDNAIKYGYRYPAVWRQRGNALQMLNRLEEALESYDSALVWLDSNPDRTTRRALSIDRGRILLGLGRYVDARNYFDTSLADSDLFRFSFERSQVWWLRGYACYMMSDAEQAVMSFDSALAYDSSNCEIWFYRGTNLNDLGRYQQALESSNMSISCDSTYSRAWYLRACCHANMGDLTLAEADCDKALELDPTMDAALEMKRAIQKLRQAAPEQIGR